MTDKDLDRRLAETLEPEPKKPPNRYGPSVPPEDRLSKKRLWFHSKTSGWHPRDFCRDGNAMLALWTAMESRGYWLTTDGTIMWFVNKDSVFSNKRPVVTKLRGESKSHALAEAAAKALWVWEK